MLQLSKELLQAVYETLRLTPPFNRWNLPDGEEIYFDIKSSRGSVADYEYKDGKHYMRASANNIAYLQTLINFVAHEMVHLRIQLQYPTDHSEHGHNFKRLASQVCKYHGFDPKLF